MRRKGIFIGGNARWQNGHWQSNKKSNRPILNKYYWVRGLFPDMDEHVYILCAYVEDEGGQYGFKPAQSINTACFYTPSNPDGSVVTKNSQTGIYNVSMRRELTFNYGDITFFMNAIDFTYSARNIISQYVTFANASGQTQYINDVTEVYNDRGLTPSIADVITPTAVPPAPRNYSHPYTETFSTVPMWYAQRTPKYLNVNANGVAFPIAIRGLLTAYTLTSYTTAGSETSGYAGDYLEDPFNHDGGSRWVLGDAVVNGSPFFEANNTPQTINVETYTFEVSVNNIDIGKTSVDFGANSLIRMVVQNGSTSGYNFLRGYIRYDSSSNDNLVFILSQDTSREWVPAFESSIITTIT